jgi:hypothetical protein
MRMTRLIGIVGVSASLNELVVGRRLHRAIGGGDVEVRIDQLCRRAHHGAGGAQSREFRPSAPQREDEDRASKSGKSQRRSACGVMASHADA